MNEQARRALAVHEDYRAPENIDDWSPCPDCGARPHVWIFDNGSHAKCLCSHRWEPAAVSTEPAMHYARRNGGSLEGYDRDGLRRRWGKHVDLRRKARGEG